MDAHHAAHYAIAGGLFAALVGVGVSDKPAPVPTASTELAGVLDKLPVHAVKIYCLPSYCDIADSLADRLDAAGWPNSVETAIEASSGIGVKATPEFYAAIRDAVSKPVKFQALDTDAPFEIIVGKPDRGSVK